MPLRANEEKLVNRFDVMVDFFSEIDSMYSFK